jgi:hypothetical protein
MITIESGPMRWFPNRVRWIIGLAAALLLLGGCSMVRLGYSQAPSLAYWWLDGYVDFGTEQTPRVREAIDAWFDWHRRTQLPDYAALLARAQREVMDPVSPEAMCAWRDVAQRRLEVAVEQAAPALGALVATLTPEQLQHMQHKLAKDGAELRTEFAQRERAERAKASFKRTLERYETFYGKLDDPQRARLQQLLTVSVFDADRWLAERDQRNAEMMRTLTTAAATRDPARAEAAVRVLAEWSMRSPRPEYRAYQERLSLENCALASTMHNLMTPAQRQYARDKLKGWEDDLRLLAASNGATASAASRGR